MSEEEQEKLYDLLFKDTKNKLEQTIEKLKEHICNINNRNSRQRIQLKKIQEELNKEKEKNKLLIEGKFREVANKNSYINDNYISKDKIREKLEELKAMEISQDIYTTDIEKMLEELLEE